MKKKFIALVVIMMISVITIIKVKAQEAPGINPEHMPDTSSQGFKPKAADTVRILKKKKPGYYFSRPSTGYSYEPIPVGSIFAILERKQLLFLLSRLKLV